MRNSLEEREPDRPHRPLGASCLNGGGAEARQRAVLERDPGHQIATEARRDDARTGAACEHLRRLRPSAAAKPTRECGDGAQEGQPLEVLERAAVTLRNPLARARLVGAGAGRDLQ